MAKKITSTEDITRTKHEQLLYTSLRIRAQNAGGSGTVLFSAPGNPSKPDEKETYVLTNHHVVEGLITVEEEWDSLLGRKVKKEKKATARAEVFKYNYLSRNVGQTGLEADIVAYDARLDLALLKLRDITGLSNVANMLPTDAIQELHIYDQVTAVGAQLGVPPISTNGEIVYMDAEIDNERYIMGTYNSIYGSSGGAVFRWSEIRERYEFIGVPARITVVPKMFDVEAITHMSYFIPIESVFSFLKDWCYHFIFDPKANAAHCHQMRERMRADSRKTLERMYGVVDQEAEKTPKQ